MRRICFILTAFFVITFMGVEAGPMNYDYLLKLSKAMTSADYAEPSNHELLNVTDEKGYYLLEEGKPLQILRGACHQFGVFHQTSNVLLISPNLSTSGEVQIILQKRSLKRPVFPGFYTVSAGGHMAGSTDPVASIIREAKEELDLNIDKKRLKPLGDGKKGFKNFLKVWDYKEGESNISLIQLDPAGEYISIYGLPEKITGEEQEKIDKIMEYLKSTGSFSLGEDGPEGLMLKTFNQEFCFYFLYPLSEEELSNIEFSDGEVEGLKEVSVSEFIRNKNLTDSTFTLMRNVPDLEELIRINWLSE